MADTENHTEAKGLYTFKTIEKIVYTYAVPASSWDEAKELITENGTYDYIKIGYGEHYGGEYMGASEPRRATLLRKVECLGDQFTFTKQTSEYEQSRYPNAPKTIFVNVDHSDKLLIKDIHISEYSDHTHNVVNVRENGFCECCCEMLNDGFAMIPRTTATHTRWGKLLSEGEE